MPELPEVETVMRGLAPHLAGRRIARVIQRRPDLRFPLPERFAARLAGRRILRLNRRAKYILATLEGGEVLLVHLGMTGRFTVTRPAGRGRARLGQFHHEAGAHAAHDHIVVAMEDGTLLTYNDARRFGYMMLIAEDELARHPLLAQIGVEPLGNELTPALLAAKARGRRADLKAFLMDQRIIAGLGNIYVCEALYRARLAPLRPAGTLTTRSGAPHERAHRLVAAIRSVLAEAIAAGGSTLRDYRAADGALGYFQKAFAVYDRAGEACPTPGCRGIVRRTIQGARSTFHCAVCQR